VDTSLKIGVSVVWAVFLLYWLVAAVVAKRGSRRRRALPPGLFIAAAFLLVRLLRPGSVPVDSRVLQVAGATLLLSGLGVAVWARIHIGRNWGMPMTEKDAPELVTSGPYRLVRHPIYSGLLLAVLGTSLVINIDLLIAFGVMVAYFVYSALVEERLLTTSFPTAYPSYRARTKMLIPFVF
jgi:protein-S-isoprenylcysteine O-methyltransferase Ste14